MVPKIVKGYEISDLRTLVALDLIDKHLAKNYDPYPSMVVFGEGSWLIEPTGRKYLDFLAGYSCVLAHGNEHVANAMKKQLDMGLCNPGRQLNNEPNAHWAERLAWATGYDRALPKSDGVSSTDSALQGLFRHAIIKGIKDPLVVLTKSYFHGRTFPFQSHDIEETAKKWPIPKYPNIIVAQDTEEAVKQTFHKYKGRIVGMFVETHKGEGGPLFSTKEKFMTYRNLARENNALFVADEIQTGLGRCGYIMAWQEFGKEARPDAVTLGKALGGGIYPSSAVVGSEEFMQVYTNGTDGSTFGGNPFAGAVGIAALEVIEGKFDYKSNLIEKPKHLGFRAIEFGDYIVSELQGIKGVDVENRGLMVRMGLKELESTEKFCIDLLMDKSLKTNVFMKHGHKVGEYACTRIAPPIASITKEEVDLALESIKEVLSRYGFE